MVSDLLKLVLKTIIGKNPQQMRVFVQGLSMNDIVNWSITCRMFLEVFYQNQLFWWALTDYSIYYPTTDYKTVMLDEQIFTLEYDSCGFIPEWDSVIGKILGEHGRISVLYRTLFVYGSLEKIVDALRPTRVFSENGHDVSGGKFIFNSAEFSGEGIGEFSGEGIGEFFPVRLDLLIANGFERLVVERVYDDAFVYYPSETANSGFLPYSKIDLETVEDSSIWPGLYMGFHSGDVEIEIHDHNDPIVKTKITLPFYEVTQQRILQALNDDIRASRDAPTHDTYIITIKLN